MAIISLKSKVKVLVNVVSLREDYIRLEIDEESRNSLAINVSGRYLEDTNNDFIKSFSFPVPNQLADQLGQIPIPNGATLTETRNIQLTAGIFTILDQYKDFGLDANDWDLIV